MSLKLDIRIIYLWSSWFARSIQYWISSSLDRNSGGSISIIAFWWMVLEGLGVIPVLRSSNVSKMLQIQSFSHVLHADILQGGRHDINSLGDDVFMFNITIRAVSLEHVEGASCYGISLAVEFSESRVSTGRSGMLLECALDVPWTNGSWAITPRARRSRM